MRPAAGGRAYLPTLRQGQVQPPGTWLTSVGVRRCRILTGFYARFGYQECGRTPGCPHGYDHIHLLKQLT